MLEDLMDGRYSVEAVFAAVSGVGLFFRGFGRLRIARKIENTPTCRIRSLPLGSVEISGTAEVDEPLEAPLSAKPTAYYRVEVEEYRRRRYGSSWVSVHSEASEEPFAVDDGTGSVLVLPAGAETHIPVDFRHESFTLNDVPPHIEQRLEAWRVRRGLFGKRLRLSERRLDVGAQVYVYGVAQERPDLRLIQAERINQKLRDVRSDPDAMRAYDIDGDGQISEAEWDLVRSQARAEVRSEGIPDRVVIARGSSGEMFLISDRRERDLVGRLRLRAAAFVFGGGALTIGAATYLLHLAGLLA